MSKKKNNDIRVKNCPFHHQNAKEQALSVIDVTKQGKYAVCCNICGALGPMAMDPIMAINRWNARGVLILEKEAYEKLIEKTGNEDVKEETDKNA